jgi:hypothetical protein
MASRDVVQLHWGGGTPTFLSHDEMRQLMDSTRKHFRLLDGGEYSIEVDPRKVDVRQRQTARRTRLQPHERRRAGFRREGAGGRQSHAERRRN